MATGTLGAVIRERRRDLGMSQEVLARRVSELTTSNMRQSDISRLERSGAALPRQQRLEGWAQALEVPLGDLLACSGWAARRIPLAWGAAR